MKKCLFNFQLLALSGGEGFNVQLLETTHGVLGDHALRKVNYK